MKKRILHLKCNGDGLFICPIPTCLHIGYKSKRGLRKHIDHTHNWYYYFDVQPAVTREEAMEKEKDKMKCFTHKQPAFSLEDGIGHKFLKWLSTPCGGGKGKKEGIQIARRSMKFLKAPIGEQ